jgi:hypothetical protein
MCRSTTASGPLTEISLAYSGVSPCNVPSTEEPRRTLRCELPEDLVIRVRDDKFELHSTVFSTVLGRNRRGIKRDREVAQIVGGIPRNDLCIYAVTITEGVKLLIVGPGDKQDIGTG